MNAVKTQATDLSARDSFKPEDYQGLQEEMQGAGGITLDISKEEDGTYYFNLDSFSTLYDRLSQQSEGLTIIKTSGQSIVFNSNKTDIKTMKYKVVQDGTVYYSDRLAFPDSGNANTYMEIASSIIFNFPSARKAEFGNICGIVLAPEAEVTVSGVGSGWLVANTLNESNEWHFTNTKLTAVPIDVTLQAKKQIDNHEPGDTDPKFNFTLQERKQDGNYQVVQNAENNGSSVTFNPITFTGEDVGDHIYKITEKPENDGKYEYDTSAYYAKVTVTTKIESNKEKTEAQVSYYSDEACTQEITSDSKEQKVPTFNNKTKHTTSITIPCKKMLVGRSLLEGESFKFSLTEVNSATGQTKKTNGVDQEVTVDRLNPNNEGNYEGNFSFNLTYTKSEDIGDHYYLIREEIPTEATGNVKDGLTYDSHSAIVHVRVANDLSKAELVDRDSKPITFTNKFTPASIRLSGTKTLTGAKISDYDGQFHFVLYNKDQKKEIQTVSNGTDGKFTFKTLNFDKPGDYAYTVHEKKEGLAGITYDTTVYNVVVSVTQENDGTLTARAKYYDKEEKPLDQTEATFTNTYTASPTALILSGNKTLSGADLSKLSGIFRFELLDSSKKVIDTAKNDASGRFTFAPIEYDKAGDYTYFIQEMNGGKTIDGIEYDGSVYKVTVHVTDNGQGQLQTKATLEKVGSDGKTTEKSNNITFNNRKLTNITVTKIWNDNSNKEGLRPESITLELYQDGEVVRTTELSGVSDNWTYTFQNLEPGVYTVHETCDSPYYEVDSNDQIADTRVTAGDNETSSTAEVTLTNTYGRKVDVTAYKDLTGAKLLDGEFHFKLHRNSDADSSKDLEAVNNADGTINFTDVDYDAKGYTVYELRDSSMTDISFDENNSVDPANTNPIDYTKTGIQFLADGTPADDNNYTIRNEYRPIVLRVQKRSKSAPYDPLVNAVYGLYQVNANGNDILVESELSDANGYMYYGRIEPGTVYYFKEISAPAGHEVDPYPGQHFMVKYIGNGQIAVYDETGTTKLDYGDITESPEEKDKPYRTIQVNTEKTDLDSITASENEEKYSYSGNGVKAVATAAKGVLPEGTRLIVKKIDPKTQTASYQSPTGVQTQSLETMLENNVGDFTGLAYYDISFMNGDEEVEPTGDVHVTLEPDQALDLQGADPSDLKIVHIVESGEPEDLTRTVSLVTGSVASDGKSVLQTSLTSDSFSVYALVDPKDSTLNGNYMLTAAGVGDFTAKLRVAKVDSSGNFIPNATLCVYKFDATKKDGLGEKVLEWTSAEGVQDWQRKVDVETPYVLVETNAPKGYKIADNIYFSIGKYHSELTCYAYDAKTGKLTESQELTQKNTNGSELVMVDDPIMVTTNYKTKVIPNHKSRTEDKVLYVAGSPKTGEFTASMPWALPVASAAMVLLILTGYLLGKKKRSRK
jgi:pilin isopeptide linkage protein